MADPLVTIVIVPRDRFSCSQESLENIYQNTDVPFELFYIDCGSPAHIRDHFAKVAKDKGFHLIRKDYYMTPNEARNAALAEIKTKYAVFADNDILVAKGWLQALISCAEETGCAIAAPLVCQDTPYHENVHYAGGELEIKEEMKDGKMQRFIHETHTYQQGIKHFDIKPPLKREPIGYTEPHCFLIRTDFLKKIGGFDEGIKGTREHVDLSLSVRKAGGTIYFEPKANISFMTHFTAERLKPWEEDFFNLRWSDGWAHDSLSHLAKKWNLSENNYFTRRYSSMGWRRRMFTIKPKIAHIKVPVVRRLLEEVMVVMDRVNNKKLTDAFDKRKSQGSNA